MTPRYFLDYGVVFVKCPNDLTKRKIWAMVAGKDKESVIKYRKEGIETDITTSLFGILFVRRFISTSPKVMSTQNVCLWPYLQKGTLQT